MKMKVVLLLLFYILLVFHIIIIYYIFFANSVIQNYKDARSILVKLRRDFPGKVHIYFGVDAMDLSNHDILVQSFMISFNLISRMALKSLLSWKHTRSCWKAFLVGQRIGSKKGDW